MSSPMIGIGAFVRVVRGWEPEIQTGKYRSRVGQTGRVVALLTDDHGATVQNPGLIVDNHIGLVWPEEVVVVADG